jgi:hypothetical protein
MLMTTGAGLSLLAPDGNDNVALNLPVLPPAVTATLTVFPDRVAVTFSSEWSG